MEYYLEYFIPLAAFLLDAIVGDPRSRYHPVVLIGNVIEFYESIFYHPEDGVIKKLFFGFVTVLLVLGTAGIIGIVLIMLGNAIHLWVGFAVKVFLLYSAISPRSLAEAGMELYSLLKKKNISKAREKVGWIVGRDTADLDEGEIARATVETISENTVDGIIAPFFYCALFGPMGAFLYRTINTMDSMLGYKNARYIYFGRFAARLDDVANWIPARITFLLLTLSAFLLREDAKRAWSIGLRDAKKHPSPNGGYAEAPVAGALHVRLGGYNKYGEKITFREYMGNPDELLSAVHIKRTIRLMYITALMGMVITTVIYISKG